MPKGFRNPWLHFSRKRREVNSVPRSHQYDHASALQTCPAATQSDNIKEIRPARDNYLESPSGSRLVAGDTNSPDSTRRSAPVPIAVPIGYQTPDPNPPDQRGFLANAHHCVFHNTKMVENEHLVYQYFASGRPVLELLEEKRTLGAEVDSSARYPPPKCHSDTRQALRKGITTWLGDVKRHWNIFWIMGPAGVGKSAVAQTIAEHCRNTGQLGAAFFFSGSNNCDDPLRVIPTLSHQLATYDPDYKKVITEQLAADSTILEKNLHTQFKRLIVEPCTMLKARRPLMAYKPLLIILDGLDECNDEDAQREFIELISQHARLNRTPTFLWMICSRPESHLKNLLRRTDFNVPCIREELPIDDPIARQDVYCYLRSGFNDIRRQHPHLLNVGRAEVWPPEATLRQIALVVSGLFILASTILKFVGDKDRRNPQAQLDICLKFIGNWRWPGTANPLHTLDLLYLQILSTVHRDTLPTTMRILNFLIFYLSGDDAVPLSCANVAKFLGLDQEKFYSALDRLHSVLDVPSPEEATFRPLRLFHVSFGEFLQDPIRSGAFSLKGQNMRCDLAIRFIRWCNYHLDYTAYSSIGRRNSHHLYILDGWVEDIYIPEPLSKDMITFIWRWIWEILGTIEDPREVSLVLAELYQFNFDLLTSNQCDGPLRVHFRRFLTWLSNVQAPNRKLLRLIPAGKTDQALFSIYDGPAFMRPYVENENEQYRMISPARRNTLPSSNARNSSYITADTGLLWLGYGEHTCLLVAYVQTGIYAPGGVLFGNRCPMDQLNNWFEIDGFVVA